MNRPGVKNPMLSSANTVTVGNRRSIESIYPTPHDGSVKRARTNPNSPNPNVPYPVQSSSMLGLSGNSKATNQDSRKRNPRNETNTQGSWPQGGSFAPIYPQTQSVPQINESYAHPQVQHQSFTQYPQV